MRVITTFLLLLILGYEIAGYHNQNKLNPKTSIRIRTNGLIQLEPKLSYNAFNPRGISTLTVPSSSSSSSYISDGVTTTKTQTQTPKDVNLNLLGRLKRFFGISTSQCSQLYNVPLDIAHFIKRSIAGLVLFMTMLSMRPSIAKASTMSESKSSTSTYEKIKNEVQISSRNQVVKKRAVVDIIIADSSTKSVSFSAPTSEIGSSGQSTTAITAEAVPLHRSPTVKMKQALQRKNIFNTKVPSNLLERAIDEVDREVFKEIGNTFLDLKTSLQGAKLDTLIMLIATGAVIPFAKEIGLSPIIGFMLAGTVLGPNCLNWIKDVHMIDILGELGIVFFLFEMGLELSINRLKKMRKDVFGLGTCQFIATSIAGTCVAAACGISTSAAVVIGSSLALSSSAFSLQLLKDKNAMGTRHGKASFGILLLQDLAVVPLLVVVELLSRGGSGLGKALALAAVKVVCVVTSMSLVGRRILDPMFGKVATSKSQEAFLSIILATVLLMSFVTKGIGLSDTLGAFLAGILLSETSYRYQIESDIAPFRGLLLGFFFMTVGFSIDPKLIFTDGLNILGMVVGLLVGKASIITFFSVVFGIPLQSAQHAGLLTASGGEFAFVAFGIAERLGLLPPRMVKRLLTVVAISMACTPALDEFGGEVSKLMERSQGYKHFVGEDSAADEIRTEMTKQKDDFVIILGYGRVGGLIGKMLGQGLTKYIAIDSSPDIAFKARSEDLPVFFGDTERMDVLKKHNVGSAAAIVITFSSMKRVNRAVLRIRKAYPDVPIIVRAKTETHKQRLEEMYTNVTAIGPVLSLDSDLLTIPFLATVLQRAGTSRPEIESMIDDVRKQSMQELFPGDGLEEPSVDGDDVNSSFTINNIFEGFSRVRNPIQVLINEGTQSALDEQENGKDKDKDKDSGNNSELIIVDEDRSMAEVNFTGTSSY